MGWHWHSSECYRRLGSFIQSIEQEVSGLAKQPAVEVGDQTKSRFVKLNLNNDRSRKRVKNKDGDNL